MTAHDALAAELRAVLPGRRVSTDPLRNAALGADASVYLLVPKVVVEVGGEDEVVTVLAASARHGTPVTFRAGGTSLSGQGVTDSVLVLQAPGAFRRLEVADGAATVTAAVGLLGGEVNAALARHGRRIGPDPASLAVARMGGILANNSSGMCCGPGEDAYHTLRGLRAVLADGSVLDTRSAGARDGFRRTHAALLARLAALRARAVGDAELAALIRRKYRIKNTTGYALNALLDHEDPLEILAHLLIGSEGTLAFVVEATLATVPDPPGRACALALFPDLGAACRAAAGLPGVAAAAELMDRASLRAVEDARGVPEGLAGLPDGAAALLVEVRDGDADGLAARVGAAARALEAERPFAAPRFHGAEDPLHAALWRVRKGLFPSVGAARPPGTAVVIEDVAVPPAELAACAAGLREAFARNGADAAILFGHALAGNLHFVLTPSFDDDRGIELYGRLLDDVAGVVLDRHGGSLKGEHGTGRNVAPFVEREWGAAATELMWEIKEACDPRGLLNPGVLLDRDPRAHLRNLKSMPLVDARVDACIECGFCERTCPSRDLTFTPRRRIAALRAGVRAGVDAGELLAEEIDATCATDGVCALSCPVGIDTGALVKSRRAARGGVRGLGFVARHLDGTAAAARTALRAAAWAAGIVGPERVAAWSGRLRAVTGDALPAWRPGLPVPGRVPAFSECEPPGVVHFTTCVHRVLGPHDLAEPTLDAVVTALCRRAGLGVARPPEGGALCCGLLFETKGRPDLGEALRAETVAALRRASLDGRLPILADASPCAARLADAGLSVLDPAEWLRDEVLPRVEVRPLERAVALHVPCSARRGGAAGAARAVAARCARQVVEPDGIECCGAAGDLGLRRPELPAAALRGLRAALPEAVREGCSTSRACELALGLHSGRRYRSLLHLALEAIVRT